jgi:hypothetical protein
LSGDSEWNNPEWNEGEWNEGPLATHPTPTLAITANDTYLSIAVTNAFPQPLYNMLEKWLLGETPVFITKTLPANDTFEDYNVAAGKTYFYQVTAVYSDGVTITSPVYSSDPITLSLLTLHKVIHGATTNKSGDIVQVRNRIPQARNWERVEQSFVTLAATAPLVHASDVVFRDYAANLISANNEQENLAALEDLYDDKATVCVRDQIGNLMFATISDLQETLGYNDFVQFKSDETDYSEAVD